MRWAAGRHFVRGAWIAALCGAFLPSAPARAADPNAAAIRQLVAAQNASRAAFRSALAAANAQVAAQIDTAEFGLAQSGDANAAGDQLLDAIETFQVAVAAALVIAADGQADAAQTLLSGLGSDLGGIFPLGFYPGDGTPTDAFEHAIALDTEKVYTKLRKRLAKTAQRFEAKGVGFTFRVRAPRPLPARRWSESETDFLLTFEIRIDTALGWSDLATTGDGQLRVAGAVSSNGVLPDVTIDGTRFPDSLHEDNLQRGGNRFRTDFGRAAVNEGVWLLIASQGIAAGSDLAIGVR